MTQEPRVRALAAEDGDEAVEVLCEAFRDYPVFRYTLKRSGEAYDEHLEALIGHFTRSRLLRGFPVLGLRDGGRLVGVAALNPPEPPPAPRAVRERWRRVEARIGPDAVARFQAFADCCDGFRPDLPHHDLGMIGLRPADQGRGLARPLLEAVHRLAECAPGSEGVLLTTELRGNVRLYEHFGYEVLGQGRAEELTSWLMFRPNPD